MTAGQKDYQMYDRLARHGIHLLAPQVRALRRAEMALHRWAEEECNGTIQRDEETGKPVRYYQWPNGEHGASGTIPDREKGALTRIEAICRRAGVFFFHQTDPRGCALYISTEPLTDTNYTNGVAVCV